MYSPILTTLGFLVRDDEVLLVHRTRPGDEQEGKFNGLGGKVNPDEDVVACLIREIQEEAGVRVLRWKLRGTVSWPGFGKAGEDVFGFVFLVEEWEGTPSATSPEGPLSWHKIGDLGALPMWAGDRHFLPLVFDASIGQFHGVLPYLNGEPQSWAVSIGA